MARKLNSIGIKMAGADIDPRELGPDIKLTVRGGATDRDNNVNLLTARQSPGFMPARVLLDDALGQRRHAHHARLHADSVGVRYQVDGVWHDRSAIERAEGDPVLAVFKGLAALKVDDRRSRQSGAFGVEAAKEKINCNITSQGTSTGERVLLQFDVPRSWPSRRSTTSACGPRCRSSCKRLLAADRHLHFFVDARPAV